MLPEDAECSIQHLLFQVHLVLAVGGQAFALTTGGSHQ